MERALFLLIVNQEMRSQDANRFNTHLFGQYFRLQEVSKWTRCLGGAL